MFVAYTLYINMEESLHLNTTEDILAISDEPSTFEWEEIRQCQSSLDSLQNDYLVLYKQIKPVQDAVEMLKAEIRNIMQLAQGAAHSAVKQVIAHKRRKGELTEQEVTGIVNDAMKTVHENYIRIADYALKSARANIVRSRTSKGYKKNLARMRWHNFALWSFTSNPEVILEPDVHPGNCWPFSSDQSQILVKLTEKFQPAAVTLHHIAMAIPRLAEISSAPKDFAIYGLNEEAEENGTFLGQFTYNSEGEPVQIFPLEVKKTDTFQYIRLKVLSNWGNPDYTCIYRFRVHRELPHEAMQRQRVENNV